MLGIFCLHSNGQQDLVEEGTKTINRRTGTIRATVDLQCQIPSPTNKGTGDGPRKGTLV